MVWPAPSVSDSRFIETPLAWPVTTTWKASNSFFAAAIFAAAVAPDGTCTPGRIFCAAGATQTWAADAEPAASKATSRGSDFTAEPPWLAASRNGGGSPLRMANSEGLPLIAQSRCGAVPKPGCLSGGRGLAGRYSYKAAPAPLRRAQGVDRLERAACAGFPALQLGGRRDGPRPGGGAGAISAARATAESAGARGSSSCAGAHCALAGGVV